MRISALTCAAALMAVPASAQALGPAIELLPGHPVYHERAREAGVVMAISITQRPRRRHGPNELCEELRVAAGLERHRGAELPPRGDLRRAVQRDGDRRVLSADRRRARRRGARPGQGDRAEHARRDRGARGDSGRLLDEPAVEQELSCAARRAGLAASLGGHPAVGGAGPDPVIESAYRRFMTIHRSIVEHSRAAHRRRSCRRKASAAPRAAWRSGRRAGTGHSAGGAA